MLTHLYIDNLVVVDRLELDFPDRLTVITGETGAGKSIMLDAIGLAIGDRAASNLIGPRRERVEIVLTVDVSRLDDARAWLDERELLEDGCHCILRRAVQRDGRSRAWINGKPSPLGELRALGHMLLELHSQHEHQSLLRRDIQRRLLDNYAGLNDLANDVSDCFAAWQAAQDKLDALRGSAGDLDAERQLLSYQLQELDALAPAEAEYEKLSSDQNRLANAEHIITTCQQAAWALNGDSSPLTERLGSIVSDLEQLGDPALQSQLDLLQGATVQIEEAARDLGRHAENLEADPQQLQEVETRLEQWFDIARKHREAPETLFELHDRLRDRHAALVGSDADMEALQTEVAALETRYSGTAAKLRKQRTKAAAKLAREVSEQLAALTIRGHFEVAVTAAARPAAHGTDQVEFLLAANPGQPASPLAKVASGGELSRVSLAIQVVTAQTSQVPTLIFDEVDVGIGGATAEVVGSLLRRLAGHAQILTVTHLAQVAAKGHRHLRVVKEDRDGLASTRIDELADADRVAEIARMLGGIDLTDRTLAHAREMFESSQSDKPSH